MRNLKKILSLALALVMVMSLLTVASAKDFNDADQIEHTEAVEVMSALGVIVGRNGNFDPKANVTRGEMAKMITYISLGNVEPDAFKGTNTNLTDINGHWAEAYIKYCYSQGIISGRGNGTFDPNASVTSTEAARMLLVAIGYNADVQIYTGSQWAINVVRDAQLSHLYDEVTVTSNEVLNRDKAAQMMYNALMTKTIEKNSSVDRVTGDITDIYTANGRPLLWKSYRARVAICDFVGNDSFKPIGTNPLKGEIIVTNGTIEDDDRTGVISPFTNATFPYDFDISNIGEQVKVIFKDGSTGTPYKPDKNDTIFGVYNTGVTNVITTIKGNVKNQETDEQRINLDGTKYDVDNSVIVYTNYATSRTYTGSGDGDTPGNYTVKASTASGKNSGLTRDLKGDNGDVIKAIIDDTTGKIDTIYITTTKIAAVTAVNSEKVSINNSVGNIDFDGNDIYSGVVRGDVVTVTTLYNSDPSDDAAYSIVRPAEVVSGVINGYKGSPNENINLSGTTYKVYDKANMLGTIPNKTTKTAVGDTEVGDEFDLYLVNGYVGAAVVTSENATNYAMVINITAGGSAGDTFDDLRLQLLCSDGTKKIITVSDKSAKTDDTDYKLGDIITYTGSDSNATVTIKKAWSTNTSTTYVDTTKTINGLVVADDCVMFAQTTGSSLGGSAPSSGDKFEVFKLRGLKTFNSAKPLIYVTNDTGTRIVAVAVNYGSRPSGSAGSTVYGMVTKSVGVTAVGENNDTYQTYIVTANGEDHTVYLPVGTSWAEKAFVYFDPIGDNIYGAADVKAVTVGTSGGILTTAVYASELVADGNDRSLSFFTEVEPDGSGFKGKNAPTTYALAKDCVITYVDMDGKKAGTDYGGDVPEFSTVYGKTNAIIVYDTGNAEITAIIVNTDGKNAYISTAGTNNDGVEGGFLNSNAIDSAASAIQGGKSASYTGSWNFNTSGMNVTVADGETLEIKGSVTGSVANVKRNVAPTAADDADDAVAVAAPVPAVTFTGGNVTGFGSVDGMTTPASPSLAIYDIVLSDVGTLSLSSKVTVTKPGGSAGVDGTVDAINEDGSVGHFYLIVGNGTKGVVTLAIDADADSTPEKYVKINFAGWTPTAD